MKRNPVSAYPVAVIESRYNGVYEGGKWHAIPRYDEVVSLESYDDYRNGDDCSAVDFWDSNDSQLIGVGETPEIAIADMWVKISTITPEDW